MRSKQKLDFKMEKSLSVNQFGRKSFQLVTQLIKLFAYTFRHVFYIFNGMVTYLKIIHKWFYELLYNEFNDSS